jgi:hypothetical protein
MTAAAAVPSEKSVVIVAPLWCGSVVFDGSGCQQGIAMTDEWD